MDTASLDSSSAPKRTRKKTFINIRKRVVLCNYENSWNHVGERETNYVMDIICLEREKERGRKNTQLDYGARQIDTNRNIQVGERGRENILYLMSSIKP